MNLEIKKEIEHELLKTERDGMEDLITYMKVIGYFEAPCSGGNHLAKEGGLAEHTLNVLHAAQKISVALIGGKNLTKEMQNSIIICSLLHDLGKCGQFGKPEYIENILASGKKSDAKPFKRNPDLLNVPHEIRSIAMSALYIDLTEEEQHAILYHNGLYGPLKYEIQGNETPLYMIIHWADMWASRVIETKKGE